LGRLKITQLCERCGKPFHPWPKRKNTKARMFCSIQCREVPVVERFWLQVGKTIGCWTWKGRVDKDGYGEFYPLMAHRFSWQLHNGPIPENLCVLHHCDNPPCTNPDHLYIGTPSDNAHDRMIRGRERGELHGMAIVNESQVREIRHRYVTENISQEYLGAEYGLSQTSISQIVLRKCWRHVE
jgi:hypothetical protein